MIVLALLASGAKALDNSGLTIWGTSADQADNLLMVRIGYEMQQRFEVGGTGKWTTANTEWGPTPDYYGVYGLYHLDQALGFYTPEAENQWEELLQALIGNPYFGLEALYNSDTKRVRPNYVIGTLFTAKDDTERRVGFVIEYVTGDAGQDIVNLGLRLKF